MLLNKGLISNFTQCGNRFVVSTANVKVKIFLQFAQLNDTIVFGLAQLPQIRDGNSRVCCVYQSVPLVRFRQGLLECMVVWLFRNNVGVFAWNVITHYLINQCCFASFTGYLRSKTNIL